MSLESGLNPLIFSSYIKVGIIHLRFARAIQHTLWFAVILPLLILLSLIVVEASKAISEYKILVTQVRNAARYLSTKSPGTGRLEASCMVRTGKPNYPCSDVPLISGLNEASVTIAIYDAINFPDTHRSQKTITGESGVRLIKSQNSFSKRNRRSRKIYSNV